jgi:hypothetical protein
MDDPGDRGDRQENRELRTSKIRHGNITPAAWNPGLARPNEFAITETRIESIKAHHVASSLLLMAIE